MLDTLLGDMIASIKKCGGLMRMGWTVVILDYISVWSLFLHYHNVRHCTGKLVVGIIMITPPPHYASMKPEAD